jgi:hypothetical protein
MIDLKLEYRHQTILTHFQKFGNKRRSTAFIKPIEAAIDTGFRL